MNYDYIMLDKKSDTPLYLQLYEEIKAAVETGRLKKGGKLPSIRKLSKDLFVSCTTVDGAYQQLCVEGYICSKPKRGYYALAAQYEKQKPEMPPQTAAKQDGVHIRYNFGTDCVDSKNIDIKVWRHYIRDVLNRKEIIASYGAHQGETELRKALSAYSYRERGAAAPPERIVVGAGTQPLLSILCGLLGRGRTVAMETPGFLQAEQVFSDCGFTVLKLPGDGSGINMNALRTSGTGLVFVSPSNSTATGMSIPMSRRLELLDWARKTGGIIIEDDHNGELRYRAHPIPSMQGLGGGCDVVYIGSFSKLLLPSVRIGYMVLTPELLERYIPRAANYNQTASKIEQLALSGYIKSGGLEKHLRHLRKLYSEKSEKLRTEIKRKFGSAIDILLQETPLTMLLTVHSAKSSGELCRIAAENGVRVTVSADGVKIRLGFAGIPIDDIEPAVSCLKEAWGEYLR